MNNSGWDGADPSGTSASFSLPPLGLGTHRLVARAHGGDLSEPTDSNTVTCTVIDSTSFDLSNEPYYLAANSGIAAGVAQGSFASGDEHHLRFGRAEGRNPLGL